MAHFSRRNFLKTGLAAGVLAGTARLPIRAAGGSATDWVTLGKSNVKVTRLAFGTGSISGQVQRNLGQDGFNRIVGDFLAQVDAGRWPTRDPRAVTASITGMR